MKKFTPISKRFTYNKISMSSNPEMDGGSCETQFISKPETPTSAQIKFFKATASAIASSGVDGVS